jgi:hypothetical protein
MIPCDECDNLVHSYCIFSAPGSNGLQTSMLKSSSTFKCDFCLVCHNCESIIEDSLFKRPSPSVKICRYCQNLYEFCPICHKGHLTRVRPAKGKRFNKELYLCECENWIHEECDQLLKRNPSNIVKAKSPKESTYNCPICRRDLKNKQVTLFIEILIMMDTKRFFTEVSSASCRKSTGP